MTEHSVAAPSLIRESAGYGLRVLAAALDALLIVLGLYLISLCWSVLTQPMEPGYPTSIVALMWAFGLLYIIGTGVLGRTVGMMATGLRITGADGAPTPRLRLMGRAALLSGVVATIVALGAWGWEPLLLIAYSLWMLVDSKHQLPHDRLFGTVVARRAVPTATPETLDKVRSQYGDLPTPVAKMLLGDLDHLRRQTRGALHLASVPMLILGLIALGGAAAGLERLGLANYLYWILAGPVGLAGTAWWFTRQRRRDGAVGSLRIIWLITILASCIGGVLVPFSLGGPIAGFGFLAVAITIGSAALGVAAGIFTLVASLELPFFAISNRFPTSLGEVIDYNGTTVILAGLGLLLIGAAGVTFRHERISA